MTPSDGALGRRLLAGAALMAVLVIVLVTGQAGRQPTEGKSAGRRDAVVQAGAGRGAFLDLPAPVTAEIPLRGQLVAEMAPGEWATIASVGEVLAGPEAFRDRLFACENTVEALPVLWKPPALGEGDAAWPAASGPAWLQGAKLARHRLMVYCRTEDRATVPAQVFFDAETADAITAVGGRSRLVLRVLGLGPAGQLLTRYVAMTAHPRPALQGDPRRPDWLAALIAPAASVGHSLTCLAAAPAKIRPDSAVETPATGALVALAAATTDTAAGASEQKRRRGLLADLGCRDGRGVDVPVLVWFSRSDGAEALRVEEETQVSVQVLGAADNRVVASFVRLEVGAAAITPTDLRRAWIQPEAAVGRSVECVSLGLPMPQTVDVGDAEDAAVNASDFASRKAWVACAQHGLPPVHMTLYFGRGAAEELLAFGRGTRIAANLLGISSNRLLGRYERVISHETAKVERAADQRRFALLPTAMLGKSLNCKLLRDLERAGTGAIPDTARSLSRHTPPGAPWLATCVDPLREHHGQLFAVFWPDLRRGDAPVAGAQLELRFIGLANDVPVADFVRRLP